MLYRVIFWIWTALIIATVGGLVTAAFNSNPEVCLTLLFFAFLLLGPIYNYGKDYLQFKEAEKFLDGEEAKWEEDEDD